MNELLKTIRGIDDNYLVGLSNKGVVKRAYKDLEGAEAKAVWDGGEADVKVGDETCRIRLPLGESQCSCPSRSICRHIIMAILSLKSAALQGDGEEEPVIEAQEQEKNEFPQLRAFSLKQLKKRLGARRYQAFVSQARSGVKPEITVTSVVTVTFPDTGITARLLEPPEYSTCSCRKKELCEHKAAAILWYQLFVGALLPEQLDSFEEEGMDIAYGQIQELCDQLRAAVRTLLAAGLARTSPDAVETMERLAIICHSEKLADFERELRSLGETYGQYFRRMASFRTEDLMARTMRLYGRAGALREAALAEDHVALRRLAGEFHTAYRPVGELRLVGVGSRYFKSRSGYEGETFYFLDQPSGRWYTYTSARPVYYDRPEGQRKRGTAQGQTPWGLTVPLYELAECTVHLKFARANRKNRLSCSSETIGEIEDKRKLTASLIAPYEYGDFSRLFEERIASKGDGWQRQKSLEEDGEGEQPVFVSAASVGEAQYDTAVQVFRLPLYDRDQLIVLVEVPYTREDAVTIRYLERIAARAQECAGSPPLFAGFVYLKDGMIKLYPIACIKRGEVESHG